MPEPDSTQLPHVVCPICGSRGLEPVHVVAEGTHTASAICANEHIFIVKWWVAA